MLSMKIFLQIPLAWQENDSVYSSRIERIALQKNNNIKIAPFPTHTQQKLKLGIIRFQYLGHRERVHRYFIIQYNLS